MTYFELKKKAKELGMIIGKGTKSKDIEEFLKSKEIKKEEIVKQSVKPSVKMEKTLIVIKSPHIDGQKKRVL